MRDTLVIFCCLAGIASVPMLIALYRKNPELALKILSAYAVAIGVFLLWRIWQNIEEVSRMRTHGFYHGPEYSFENPFAWALVLAGLFNLFVSRKLSGGILVLAVSASPLYALAIQVPYLLQRITGGPHSGTWTEEFLRLGFALIPLYFSFLGAYAVSRMDDQWFLTKPKST